MNLYRILTIDKCLKDTTRQWSLLDLINACEHTERNSKRSVQADIELMRNKERGFNAPIVVTDRKYYKYSNTKYNLLKQIIPGEDIKCIASALEVLHTYCYFEELKPARETLIALHKEINHLLKLPIDLPEDKFTPKESIDIRLWIDYELADHYKQNKIHPTQVIEQEEIDGSINVYIKMPFITKLEKLLIDNSSKVIVTSPLSIKKHIAHILEK